MAEKAAQTRQIQFLLTNLLLLLLCILGLALLVGAYPLLLAPEPTSTAAPTWTPFPTKTLTSTPTITPTLTPTRTPRPTFTPTITLTPTSTPTLTPTPMPTSVATLTPARPVAFAGRYQLVEWSPERADSLAAQLSNYPDTLSAAARGKDDGWGYYRAFRFSAFALREALLRYPEAPQAERWRWQLAYHLAQLDDPWAGQYYADFIADALIRGKTDLGQLYLWFQQQEPRMALYLVTTPPPAGYAAGYLVEVRAIAPAQLQTNASGATPQANTSPDETQPSAGSAFIRLLQTSYGEYEIQVLVSHFDFVHRIQAGWIVAELDGQPNGSELAIYFSTPRNQFTLDAPYVFDLSKVPAVELPFLPHKDIFSVGVEYENRWAVVKNKLGQTQLAFQSTVFPACPVKITRQYRWNGLYFELAHEQYEVQRSEYQSGAVYTSLGYCRLVVDSAAAYWGPAAAVSLMEALLPDWPPKTDELGRPLPPDARDEWLYRLGVQHALSGNREAAKHYFEQIIQTPSLPNSRWIEPARSFNAGYQSAEDLYRVCAASPYCDAGRALPSLTALAPANQDVLAYLRQRGVTIVSSAFYDFDLDGENERWITVRHQPMGRLEFWMLANYTGGIKALRVGYVDTNPPSLVQLEAVFVREDALNLMPVAFLEGKTAFSLRRQPDTRAPYLVSVPLRTEYPNRFLERLWAAEQNLFLGGTPGEVRDDLLELAKNPGLTCQNTWSCDPYYYLLGLAYELTGESDKAVEAYHRVWSDYSNSPYTIMARLKLSGAPALPPTPLLPTATPSPTATSGTPAGGTPGGGTPTPTPTVTQTPTLTTTNGVQTPTTTSTPTQTATQTETPTSTP